MIPESSLFGMSLSAVGFIVSAFSSIHLMRHSNKIVVPLSKYTFPSAGGNSFSEDMIICVPSTATTHTSYSSFPIVSLQGESLGIFGMYSILN